MNRDTAITLVVALLAVFALALGAATLDPLDTHSNGPSGPGHDHKSQLGGSPPANVSGTTGGALPPLVGRLVLAVFVIAVVIGLYGIARRYTPREIAKAIAVIVVMGVIIYALIQLLGDGGGFEGRNGTMGNGPMKIPGGGGGSSNDDTTGFPIPSVVLFAGLAVVLIGGAFVALRSSKIGSSAPDPEPDADDGTEMAAVGRAAGRAADRIDADADTRNEVYRAWEEMTHHLDVERPESSTPGEFADAATDAGMARSDVAELTDLFRDTRYGGHAVTDDRSSRAVAALRRIETAYAPEERSDLTVDGGRGDRGGERGRSERGSGGSDA